LILIDLEKCRWYGLVDEFIFDKTNAVSHAHTSNFTSEGIKSPITSLYSPQETQETKVDNKCNNKSLQITSSSKFARKKKKEGMVILFLKILSLLSIF
jgi:hypothetical protein